MKVGGMEVGVTMEEYILIYSSMGLLTSGMVEGGGLGRTRGVEIVISFLKNSGLIHEGNEGDCLPWSLP